MLKAKVLKKNPRFKRAMDEMRSAFAGVDSSPKKGEPTAKDREFIQKLIRKHRSA
jgi:hypothetical protein